MRSSTQMDLQDEGSGHRLHLWRWIWGFGCGHTTEAIPKVILRYQNIHEHHAQLLQKKAYECRSSNSCCQKISHIFINIVADGSRAHFQNAAFSPMVCPSITHKETSTSHHPFSSSPHCIADQPSSFCVHRRRHISAPYLFPQSPNP